MTLHLIIIWGRGGVTRQLPPVRLFAPISVATQPVASSCYIAADLIFHPEEGRDMYLRNTARYNPETLLIFTFTVEITSGRTSKHPYLWQCVSGLFDGLVVSGKN
jgi:hypothetical protein